MIKNLLKIFSVFLVIFCIQTIVASETQLRGYQAISLAKGSFLKAVSVREICTATSKAGDYVYFLNPADVYIGETNIIPKNSIYIGLIEDVTEAVEGVNASMKIRILQLRTPSGTDYNLDAYVYWRGKTMVGGDLAEAEYYTRMPHYTSGMPKGYLQYVPTSIRKFGTQRTIFAGEEVTFIMNKNVPLYKN